jgi:hypothetical protein
VFTKSAGTVTSNIAKLTVKGDAQKLDLPILHK